VSDTIPEPLDPDFQLSFGEFEGPLDLLLHLIKKHELDILDLPVAFVTERYVQYVSLMERLNLDVASEYLVMAATLAHIKSKMLLPTPPADQDEEDQDEVDPRAELIRRLLEYQKYKEVAESLGSRGVEGRDVFLRGVGAPTAEGPAPLAEVSLFKLLDAFQGVLERNQGDLSFEVSAERITIQERITQITDLLRGRSNCAFDELFQGNITTYDIVVTFLAILEMAKMRMMRIYQPDPGSPIHLEYRVTEADATGDDVDAERPPGERAGDDEERAAVQPRDADPLDLEGTGVHTSAAADEAEQPD